MTGLASWVPDGLDLDRPSAARIYDYLLGGGHNFAQDRELAERFLVAQPYAREIARLNRMYPRGHAEIRQLFDGFDIVAPGIVATSEWRPQSPTDTCDDPARAGIYAGVGRRI